MSIEADLLRLGIDPASCRIGRSVAEALAGREMAKPSETQPGATERPKRKQSGRERTATERRYEEFLDGLMDAGIVEWYRREPFTITLAPKTTYTPDYLVALTAGPLCVVEVKGHYVYEDAGPKYKIARELRQEYQWLCIRWSRGRWTIKFKNGYEPIDLVP